MTSRFLPVCILVMVCLGRFYWPAYAQVDFVEESYVLGKGDEIKVTVFGEEDLSGEFTIGADGNVTMPLIGDVPAVGLSVADLGSTLIRLYKAGYLRDPKIGVDVLTYRPFYIIGEVQAPGSYPFVSGMAVLNAVALAGGFTYRADEDTFFLKREGVSTEIEVSPEHLIFPGDIIRVDERFF